MQWNTHSHLQGKHSFLSASKYAWRRYSDDKLIETFEKSMSAALGSRLHAFAAEAISLGLKMPNTSKTINAYVNHAIGYKMQPEQMLFYSRNAFGTADAILFDVKKKLLRIHDLKNGDSKASFDQLEIYAAFFCLEYGIKPSSIDIVLRIYQSDEVHEHIPETHELIELMDKIVYFDEMIERMREEAAL